MSAYDRLTVAQLRSICRHRGIRTCIGSTYIKKADLVKKLVRNDKRPINNKVQGNPGKIIHFINDKPKIFVKGPIRLIELYNKDLDIRVYLFGEEHSKKVSCNLEPQDATIEFPDMLKRVLVKKSDKLIDVFVEIEFEDESKGMHFDYFDIVDAENAYLVKIYKAFKGCLSSVKDNCKYKNVRMHYTNIRNFPYIEDAVAAATDVEYGHSVSDARRERIRALFDYYPDFSDLVKDLKVDKQIKNVIDEKTSFLLRQMLIGFSKDYKKIQARIHKRFTRETVVQFMNVFVGLMDIYLLARMFRSYSDAPDAKNVIIYVGDFHAENYSHALTTLFDFKIIHGPAYSKNACLDITEFTPFFGPVKEPVIPTGKPRFL